MKPINVTEPFLPPLEEYVEYLRGIWERNWLTNQGPLVRELEEKLRAFHRIEMPLHCVANGGLGLQLILKSMGVKGEVITTPFSYVATTSCPLWEGCTVKFADIEPDYLTIDPDAVEATISSKTEAILATHVFGNPCDCEVLEAIAEKHGLALIYDAAHAFGVRYKGRSILEYGDASMVSLHATKLFHTVEGGFVAAKDGLVAEKVEWMRRFGHMGNEDFHGVGINAKMSELHAAMGLSILSHMQEILSRRMVISQEYTKGLSDLSEFVQPAFKKREDSDLNPAYFPVVFRSEDLLNFACARMQKDGISPRRYFRPLLNHKKLGFCPEILSFAIDVSNRILCLPLAESYDTVICERVLESIYSVIKQ